MIYGSFISKIILILCSITLQISVSYAQGDGDIQMYYVDAQLHPDAAKRDAIIAGTFNANFREAEPNFIEKSYEVALRKYQLSWGALPQNIITKGKILLFGDSGSRVSALNKRLGLNGQVFDRALAHKIVQYRRAHGLPSGISADNILIESLNRGSQYYIEKISLNKYRAAELPSDLGEKFILVDAANQMLYMYEGDQLKERMRVIVGTVDNPTPMLAGFIRFSVLNPYWNVPSDLVRDRYAQRAIDGGENYINTRGFELLSGWEDDAQKLSYNDVNWNAVKSGKQKLRFRQRPGPGNGMGDIKFMFPNRFGVYLHDTHNEESFTFDRRALSAGCVRLEKPWLLARWLHGERPKTDSDKPEQIVNLTNKVPVYISYFTALPTKSGVSFSEDIYGRDARLSSSLLEDAFVSNDFQDSTLYP